MAFWDKIGQRIGEIIEDISAPEGVREVLAQGVEALSRGDYATAETLLAQVVAQSPDRARAWHLLGLCQQAQGRLDEARASLERAAELRGEEGEILAALARLRWELGDAEGALEAVRRALRGSAGEAELVQLYRVAGEVYLERGDWDRAVRELRKAVALSEVPEPALLGLLGRALLGAGDLALARDHLARAATGWPLRREELLLLSRVLLALDRPDEARLAPLRLLEQDPDDVEARCALARAHLAAGEPEPAREQVMQVLARAPGRPEVHRLLGEVHAAVRDRAGALTHLRQALELAEEAGAAQEERLALLRLSLDQALELDPEPELAAALDQDADRLEALGADDPLARAALALALVYGDQQDRGEEALSLARSAGEDFAGLLALGAVQLWRGDPGAAVAPLRRAATLRPQSTRARALLAQAHRARAPISGSPAEIHPLLGQVQALLEGDPAFSAEAAAVHRLRRSFDDPLTVVVMGEFNSGKSTFVNALIGETVAPMGITPTTATINVLRYGESRAGRVVGRDGSEQHLSWEALERFLAGLSPEQAEAVAQVELLYPAEELLRVNVVDTPGLNSLVDAHERTARQVLGRADAVVWLFSAGQAGKQTEEQALALLRQHRLKTVGVLNKIDRLSPEEQAEVLEHLRRGFGATVGAVLPVSTRQALRAQTGGSAEALAESRFPELRAHLEQQLFARSRQLKARASRRRLLGLLGRAEGVLKARLGQSAELLSRLDALKPADAALFGPGELSLEWARLQGELAGVYRGAAREVLEFVRPRRWALGEHRFSAADRDFLHELLRDGLRGAMEGSRARLEGRLDARAGELQGDLRAALGGRHRSAAEGVAQLVEERRRLLGQQVYTRALAFARGALAGGSVDRFFEQRLPRLELSLDAVEGALLQEQPALEGELRLPLSGWAEELSAELERRLGALRGEVALDRLEQEARYYGPLAALRRDLERHLAAEDGDPAEDEAGAGTGPEDGAEPGEAGR